METDTPYDLDGTLDWNVTFRWVGFNSFAEPPRSRRLENPELPRIWGCIVTSCGSESARMHFAFTGAE